MKKNKKIDNYIGVIALIAGTILTLSFSTLVKVIHQCSTECPALTNTSAVVIASEPLQNADDYMIIIRDREKKVHFCLSGCSYSVGDSVSVSYINNRDTLRYIISDK